MADLRSRQVEKYASISPYDTDDEEMTGDTTYMKKRKYMDDYSVMMYNQLRVILYLIISTVPHLERRAIAKGQDLGGMAKLVKASLSRKDQD